MAISTLKGLSNWWTMQITRNTDIDGNIPFDFGTMEGPGMKVLEANQEKP